MFRIDGPGPQNEEEAMGKWGTRKYQGPVGLDVGKVDHCLSWMLAGM